MKVNLRPSTFAGYKSHIKNHIVPFVGHVQLNQLSPAMLDNMFQQPKKATKKKSSEMEL